MRTATKPQVNIDGQPTLLSQAPPATTETAEHHSSRRRRMDTRASTNEQIGRQPARSVPECRHIRNVPSGRHLGTFLLGRPLGTALDDSAVDSRLTAPAPRRLRQRRPGRRPWRSPRASCRCERHRQHTPARHPRRRRRHVPQDASPRRPSQAADDQRWQQARLPHRTRHAQDP